jgi:hypothetical protein
MHRVSDCETPAGFTVGSHGAVGDLSGEDKRKACSKEQWRRRLSAQMETPGNQWPAEVI